MTPVVTFFKYTAVAILAGATASSMAVSLGRLRGAAVIGRSFDVTLAAQLAGSEGLSAVCVSADLFYGDSQIPTNRVRVTTGPGANASEALIRISTNSTVDEPVVTLLVREGCSKNNTRKYVLLADVQADNTAPAPETIAEVAAAVASQLPTVREGGLKAVVPASAAQSAPAATSPRKKLPRIPSADVRPNSAATPFFLLPSARLAAKAAPDAVRKSSRSRLKLDPVDLAAERDPVLRASSELLSLPSTDDLQRAAAAALWQALNAQPQDILRDNQRLKTLEADVAGMLAQTRKTEKAVADLQVQLGQSRNERYSNWLVYTLGALLAVTLLAMAVLWSRRRNQNNVFAGGPWWGKGLEVDKPEMQDSLPEADDFEGRRFKARRLGATDRLAEAALDTHLNGEESLLDDLWKIERPQPEKPPRQPESRDRPDFSSSLSNSSGMLRIVNAEELFDVHQQADFFVSLGEFDKAVELLRHHITDNVETSALVYFDLFDLYHSMGRKDDYELLRGDFNRTFNARVPAFSEYTTDTHGLEYYASALSRIESLWPTPKVLGVIEESIFRKPDSMSQTFSLAAYRELLLLYAIAKSLVEGPAVARDPAASEWPKQSAQAAPEPSIRENKFVATNIQPLSVELRDGSARPFISENNLDLTLPPASPRLGLDIDLSGDFDLDFELELEEQSKAGVLHPFHGPLIGSELDANPLAKLFSKGA